MALLRNSHGLAGRFQDEAFIQEALSQRRFQRTQGLPCAFSRRRWTLHLGIGIEMVASMFLENVDIFVLITRAGLL